jgi:F-type H+-transporting ATPase subunit c
MDNITVIGIVSIAAATCSIVVGSVAPAIGEMKSIIQALSSIAQQPDEAATISRTLFVGLAMIESLAIYCFVISIVLIFANPFWNLVVAKAGK